MKKVVLSLGLVGLFAVQAHAQVIFSDNFNSDSTGLAVTSLTNWTLSSGMNVDVIGSGFFDFYPGNGNYIDLDGTGATVDTVLTTRNSLALAGGTNYAFTFDLGKNGGAFETFRVRVTDGVTSYVDQTIADSNSYATFARQGFAFTTSSASSVNIIFEHGNTNGAGYVVDNISLSVIPEPTTLALVGLMGLPFLGLARRRRSGS